MLGTATVILNRQKEESMKIRCSETSIQSKGCMSVWSSIGLPQRAGELNCDTEPRAHGSQGTSVKSRKDAGVKEVELRLQQEGFQNRES